MIINLKDSANPGHVYTLEIGNMPINRFNSIPVNDTITVAGKTWSCSKSIQGNTVFAELRMNSGGYDFDEANPLFSYLDLNIVASRPDEVFSVPADYVLVPVDQTGSIPAYTMGYTNVPPYGDVTMLHRQTIQLTNSYLSPIQFEEKETTLLNEFSKTYGAPCVFGDDHGWYFGYFVYIVSRAGTSSNINILYLFCNKDITTDNFTDFDYNPGEKGFRPTSARTNADNPGVGGRGSTNKKDPDYAGDSISLPGAPDESVASAVGCGFVNCYKVDTANLEKVGQCLYGSTLLGLIQSISVNPLDFIISLMIFPCSPNVGSTENIKLGGWLAAASGGAALGFDATGAKLSTQFKTVSFGSVTIPENWGNFLDYSQTNIELYLPFIGSVSIDVSECMGGTIEVEYTIDFFTGMCVANVLCTRSNYKLPSGKALTNVHAEHAYQGNCAIQIPLSSVNYGSMVGSLINACTQGITNPVAGFTGIVTDAISGGLRPNISSKGNIVANSGFCSVLYPYVRITRPITAEPDSYQEVMGYPSYINTNLGQYEGLCVCDDIDLTGINGATESELNKIRQYCKDGVYV